MTENEMVGWHHQINANKFEKTQGDSEEQGSLACCSPWDYKELDTTYSDCKASVCNASDPGSIPGLGRSPGEGNGSPLQYSCLENPMDGGAW